MSTITKDVKDVKALTLAYLDGQTLSDEQMKLVRDGLAAKDKAARKANPNAKGLVSRGSKYESQEMDEMFQVLADIVTHGDKAEIPANYRKISKDEAIKLRDSLTAVVTLGKKFVAEKHMLDFRFDTRGHGWAKATEIWRKEGEGEDAKNVQQAHFESYKGNPTVKLV